jgi:hypothetical protein
MLPVHKLRMWPCLAAFTLRPWALCSLWSLFVLIHLCPPSLPSLPPPNYFGVSEIKNHLRFLCIVKPMASSFTYHLMHLQRNLLMYLGSTLYSWIFIWEKSPPTLKDDQPMHKHMTEASYTFESHMCNTSYICLSCSLQWVTSPWSEGHSPQLWGWDSTPPCSRPTYPLIWELPETCSFTWHLHPSSHPFSGGTPRKEGVCMIGVFEICLFYVDV